MAFRDEGILDITTPRNELLSAKYKRSFAYTTVKDRLPVILTKIVDHLARDKDEIAVQWGEEARGEIKEAIGKISGLKNEISTNKCFVPLTSDAPDVAMWNQFLEEQQRIENQDLKWFWTVWLYAECYMYRRVREIFENMKVLKTFDHFSSFKQASLEHGMESFNVLAEHLVSTSNMPVKPKEEVKQELFKWFKLNLWANKCDLSISEGVVKGMGTDPLGLAEDLEPNILASDLEDVWDLLMSLSNPVIDIVCDNSGYELFLDMCLADFLIAHSFASTVRFHTKSIPWFVSDAMKEDFLQLLNTLSESEGQLSELGKRWQGYVENGSWVILSSYFWTAPYAFHDMKIRGPQVYETLENAQLAIFKGDLNYRKLVGERNWPPSESFKIALQEFLPTNICALRTLKSEPVCGLKPGVDRDLAARDSKWNLTGDYGVIQLARMS